MVSRQRWGRLALCVLLSSAALAVPGHGAGQTAAGNPGPVIILGDSISAGCCAPIEETWPVIFAERLGADLVNLAMGGDTSDSLISELRTWPSGRTQSQLDEALSVLAESETVAAVALGIGTNDGFQIFTLRDPDSGELCASDPTAACQALVQAVFDTFHANLHLILSALSAALEPGTPLVVMTVYVGGRDQILNSIILSEVVEHDALLADVAEYFDELDQSEILAGDGVHKVAAGHRVIADVFSNAIPPDSDGDGLSDLMEAVLGSDVYAEDSDGDGCGDGDEFGPRAMEGGQRDPTTVWDYFNPTNDGQNRLDDILIVLNHYFLREGEPGYDVKYDRSTIPETAEQPWRLGPPSGQVLVDDILHAVNSYFHDCGTGIVKPTPTATPTATPPP